MLSSWEGCRGRPGVLPNIAAVDLWFPARTSIPRSADRPVPRPAHQRRASARLYAHEEGGATHPLVWARTLGRSRVVYSALGHDTRSYESPGHVELLRRITAWLRTDGDHRA
ncbi:ThuA domain-containing protein [Micromonospora sp. NBC_00617]